MDIQLAKNHAAGYKWAKLAAGFLGRPKVIILWRGNRWLSSFQL